MKLSLILLLLINNSFSCIELFSHLDLTHISKTRKIKKIINKYKKTEFLSGVGLIKQGNRTLFKKSHGYAHIEYKVKNKVDTKIRIASLGKQFTSAAILKLVEQRKLKLSDKISQYFETPSSWEEITIHHLLSHTSGFQRHFLSYVFDEGGVDLSLEYYPFTFKERFERFKELPLLFNPGEKFSYSNEGYVLLGELISRVSGNEYKAFIQNELFNPHGLDNTGVNSGIRMDYEGMDTFRYSVGEIVDNLASNYTVSKSGKWGSEVGIYPAGSGSAGAHYSTVDDLHNWIKALYSKEVLSPELTKALFTPHTPMNSEQTLHYGYGWMLRDFESKSGKKYNVIHHTGASLSSTSLLAYVPELDLTIVLLANFDTMHYPESGFYKYRMLYDIINALD